MGEEEDDGGGEGGTAAVDKRKFWVGSFVASAKMNDVKYLLLNQLGVTGMFRDYKVGANLQLKMKKRKELGMSSCVGCMGCVGGT